MPAIKKIGVLTSGGDCAGLNAVIRAVTYRAIQTYGWEVIGIHDGSIGLMEPRQFTPLTIDSFGGNVLRQGGTILGTTNRGNPFAYPMPDGTTKDRSGEFAEGIKELGLDALVVIGGDGSMAIMSKLCHAAGVRMVGIPKTIDNDVHGTERAVGFATAVDVVVDALDRLAATAASHHRIMILEVMGRDAGHIALEAGIAGGADAILIPEIPYKLGPLAQKLRKAMGARRKHALVVVAEGVKTETGDQAMVTYADGQQRLAGIGTYLTDKLASLTDAETRVTILGHVQRGGTPVPQDRVLASAFGTHAVDLIAEGKFDRMVGWVDRGVIDVPLEKVTIGSRGVDLNDTLVHTARGARHLRRRVIPATGRGRPPPLPRPPVSRPPIPRRSAAGPCAGRRGTPAGTPRRRR